MKETNKMYQAADYLKMFRGKDEKFWQKVQQKRLQQLFSEMRKNIPAYKKFLKENGYAEKDYRKAPAMNKANYVNSYDFSELFWPDQKKLNILTSTSGSTGKPTPFVRSESIDWQHSVVSEYFLRNGKPGKTIFVDCFSMGIWIGGLISYQAIRDAAIRMKMDLTLATPGINMKEIHNVLRFAENKYDTVILAGYPPFLKDVIDSLNDAKITLKNCRVRLCFAAESFTEKFRDYLFNAVSIENVYCDTMNIYGSAELGAMAFETPTSIFVRRLALENQEVYDGLFNSGRKIPTLAQFNPFFVAIEEDEGALLLSANNVTPMFRYKIGDAGGVMTYSQIKKHFANYGIDLEKEARKEGIKLEQMPFAYIYERMDMSTTLYGLQIYPQSIKQALEHDRFKDYITGKFTMQQAYDENSNQFLEINLELKPGKEVNKELSENIQSEIIQVLQQQNSEYRELYKLVSEAHTKPRLNFWNYSHELYFKPGTKQQWVKKGN